MLAPMVKVRIIGKLDRLETAVDVLGTVGVVHLTDVQTGAEDATGGLAPCQRSGAADERRRALRERLHLVEEVAHLLDLSLEAGTASDADAGPGASVAEDLPRLRELTASRAELRDELALAQRYRGLCRAFAPVLGDLEHLRHLSSLGITFDARHRDQVLPALRQQLAKITPAFELLWRPVDESTVGVLLLFPPRVSAQVGALLSRESIHEVRLPHRYEGMPLQEGLVAVERLLDEVPRELARVDRQLAEYADRYRAPLAAEYKRLQSLLAQSQVESHFAATRYLFVIEGFLPQGDQGRLERALDDALDGQVAVNAVEVPPEERSAVPIAFENPPFLRPFERLLAILPPPRYGTLDPTPLLALSFPLFFGLMLGDAGYGVLVVLLGVAVRHRWRERPWGRDVGFLLQVAGVSGVLFGVAFGEVFGDLGHTLGLRPLWRDRLPAAATLLGLTVAVGAGHVVLGFLLGALQGVRARLPGKAVGNLASVAVLGALFVLLAGAARVLPETPWRVAAAVLVLGLVLLVYLEGVVALVELVSALGNILSYARLMALGVASAALAVVANQLGGAVGGVAAGAAVAVVLHALNLVLGLFSPTLHSLRLHYVEFLPRFYQYGGRAYRPFRKGEAT